MKEWNEGYTSALDRSAERNPYSESEKKSLHWSKGYTAALRDMDKFGDTTSGKYKLRKLLEDNYPTYIRKRLEDWWSLTEAKSIPCLGSCEWKIKSRSLGTFLAKTEVGGERIIIGEYRSPKEALAVLKKNEKNLATGLHINPHVKTRYSKAVDKLFTVWDVTATLQEWSEVFDVSVSALKQRARNNKRTIEREIKLRLMEMLRYYKKIKITPRTVLLSKCFQSSSGNSKMAKISILLLAPSHLPLQLNFGVNILAPPNQPHTLTGC